MRKKRKSPSRLVLVRKGREDFAEVVSADSGPEAFDSASPVVHEMDEVQRLRDHNRLRLNDVAMYV